MQQVGRYNVRGQLGRGAMGVVYLAEDPVLNRQVAIKTIDLAVDDPGEREFLRHRLLRDARAAAALSHPNIVGVYDVLEEGAAAYVVMEYVPGESLAERLRSGARPDPETAVRMLRQMAAALDYTHSRGVIHRDIKPGNVMIDASGTAKIMDFGIARISDTRTVTPTGMVMGTAEYMAPEQIKGEAVDGRADQFSLAAVAYQMMTGSTLFGQHTLATLTYKIVNEMPPPPTARNAALPAAVDAVLAKALAKSPGARYSTCSGFVEALGDAFSGGLPAAAPPPAEVAAGGSGKRVWLSLAGGVLIAGGVLAIWQPWARAPAPRPAAATEMRLPVETALPAPVAPAGKPRPAPAKPQEAPDLGEKAKPRETAKPEEPPASEPAGRAAPEETALPFRRGQEQMKAHDYQAAIQSFTQAISLHPRNAQAYSSRGVAHQRLEQNKAAVEDYSQAILLAPREASAYAGRGVCLVRLRHDDDAFADFNRALELEPDLAAALNGRGGVYLRRGQYARAMHDFDAAIRANPRLAQAYQNRARARQATGDTSGAASDLQMEQRLRGQEKD